MLSPLGWYYNYLYGLPAIVVLMSVLGKLGPAWRSALIVDFVLIGGTLREVLGKTVFQFYTWHALLVLNFVLILAALVAVRRRRLG
jgi:hypothetical protein